MIVAPTIVIPGITASTLRDEYALPPETVWSTVRKRAWERVTLHPRDQRYELVEPARVVRGSPFSLVYDDLIEELREGLSEGLGGPVPVFPFGYDWRMPLSYTEARLARFVEEVLDRTLLLPHYRDDERFRARPAVNLVGHSMGGLIIAGYVERSAGHLVGKVVTLASPFAGSHEAVLKITTGTAELGDDPGKARERRMARMTPALYHLLPRFARAVDADDGLESDLFRPEAWQPSVARTIEREAAGWGVADRDLFAAMLDDAREHRRRISGLRLLGREDGDGSRNRVGPRDWLAVAGVDAKTRVRLRVVRGADGAPRFLLRSAERRNDWDPDEGGDRLDTGDGTVPLAGALPPFLDPSRVVCVTPGDFGYWELRDRVLSAGAGFHGILPKMNMLHRLVLRFLSGGRDTYGNTWGRRVPGVATWRPPLELEEKDGPDEGAS